MAGRAAGTPVVAWCCIDAFVRTVLRSRAAFLGYMDSPYAYPAPSPCRRHPLPCHRRRHRHPHRYHRRKHGRHRRHAPSFVEGAPPPSSPLPKPSTLILIRAASLVRGSYAEARSRRMHQVATKGACMR